MKQMTMEGDAPFLPEEILTYILKRLPVKSLLRFQCVCKHWKNLLKTPSFIADHLGYSSVQNPSLLLRRYSTREYLHINLIDREMHVLEVQSPALILGSFPVVRIIGSCNGLLCIAIDEFDASYSTHLRCSSLLLWNAASRELRQVPRTRSFPLDCWNCAIGFGFSATVNDYKIVKANAKTGVVQVYSLSTNSWKEIKFGSLEGISLFGDPVTVNGYMFCYGNEQSMEEEDEDGIVVILSFDIAKEVFSLIAQPPLSDGSFFQLTVFEDKFAILSLTRIGGFPNYIHSVIDLWVLEGDIGSSTVKWSWTKKWSSNPCSPTLHLRTIWRNEIVCFDFVGPRIANESGLEIENDEQQSVLYLINISTKESKTVVIPRCSPSLRPDVFSHVESLIPVGNIRNEEP